MLFSFICNIVRQICVESDYSQLHCWFLGLRRFLLSLNHCGRKFLVWNSSNICLKMEFSRLMNGWLCLWLLPFTLGPYFTLGRLFGGTNSVNSEMHLNILQNTFSRCTVCQAETVNWIFSWSGSWLEEWDEEETTFKKHKMEKQLKPVASLTEACEKDETLIWAHLYAPN